MTSERIPVCCALITDGDCFLIAQIPRGKRFSGMWEFPGGKVEPGESSSQCIRREIREELGCQFNIEKEFMGIDFDYPDIHIHLIPFLGNVVIDQIVSTIHTATDWMPISELKKHKFLLAADRKLLEQIELA